MREQPAVGPFGQVRGDGRPFRPPAEQVAHAALLRAVVENWHSDPRLRELWLELMGSYTAITEARIRADQERGVTPSSADSHDLAALDVEPFGDRKRLADMLTHVWLSALYSRPAT